MHNSYELGYLHALQKLGMVEKVSGMAQARVARGAANRVRALAGKAPQLSGPQAAETAVRGMEGTGPQAWGQQLPVNLKPAPSINLGGESPVDKSTASRVSPVTSSPAKAKAAPEKAPDKASPEKPQAKQVSQGFLSKYKWPLLGGAGLAGLGVYLNNREPMGQNPIQGY